MTRAASGFGDTLAGWLEAEGIVPVGELGAISNVDHVRTLLIATAREGRAVSYSELLGALGHRFTRPKMRAVCKTLDAIDTAAAAAGEPALAVLVVREGNGLPGQGWWTGAAEHRGYSGPWTGPEAIAFVRSIQEAAFRYWRERV